MKGKRRFSLTKAMKGLRKLSVEVIATVLVFQGKISDEHWFIITIIFLGANVVEHIKPIMEFLRGGKNA